MPYTTLDNNSPNGSSRQQSNIQTMPLHSISEKHDFKSMVEIELSVRLSSDMGSAFAGSRYEHPPK